VEVPSIDLVLAPVKVMIQDRLLKPLWARAHPLYLRFFGEDHAV
jgi:hypothetical protein